jgi:phage tail-like protein
MQCRRPKVGFLPAQRGVAVVEAADRMFASLPAVFRNRDSTGDLARLLRVLEAFFFTGSGGDEDFFTGEGGDRDELRGLEEYLAEIPALFSPTDTPERFLHWLAAWLSFTPHSLFSPEPPRRIVAGIVPLYGLRGTKGYLVRLLELCFGDEIGAIHVDDRPKVGFTVGESKVGLDTRLAVSRPFFFKVSIGRHDAPARPVSANEAEALQRRVRAVIDFAKPAHTIYELDWAAHSRSAHRDGNSSAYSGSGS